MLASVIILNWNGLSILGPCLEAIAQNTLIEDYEVLVLDNGSEEKGIEEVVAPYPKVRLLKEFHNHGFSKGNNIAARAAVGEYLVFLNNDTLPGENWLLPLIETHRRSPEAGIVGSKLIDPDGRVQFAGAYFVPALNAFKAAYPRFPADSPELSTQRECEIYIACGISLPRKVFEAVGGFDEGYFQGHEDWDLCLRVRERGWKILYCPDSEIVHLESVSMGSLGRRERNALKEKNRRLFEERWGRRLHEFRLADVPGEFVEFSQYANPTLKLVDRVPEGLGRVLDVRCGTGAVGQYLKSTGKAAHVTGMERNASAARVASGLLDDVRIGDIESLKIDSDPFDTIFLGDVLEHLVDPWNTLFRLRRLLVAGGLLVVSIPNIGHYKVLKKSLTGEWRYDPAGIRDVTHLRFFSRRSAEEMLNSAGFEIERVETERRGTWWTRLLARVDARFADLSVEQFYFFARKLPDGGAHVSSHR